MAKRINAAVRCPRCDAIGRPTSAGRKRPTPGKVLFSCVYCGNKWTVTLKRASKTNSD